MIKTPYLKLILACAALTAQACVSSRTWFESDLALRLSDPKAQEVLKKNPTGDYFAIDQYLFLRKGRVGHLSDQFILTGDEMVVHKKYCSTGFDDDPPLLDGLMESVFLSEQTAAGILSLVLENETNGSLSCLNLTGELVRLK